MAKSRRTAKQAQAASFEQQWAEQKRKDAARKAFIAANPGVSAYDLTNDGNYYNPEIDAKWRAFLAEWTMQATERTVLAIPVPGEKDA